MSTIDAALRGGPDPSAADPHDLGRHRDGRSADRARARRGLAQPTAAGIRHRRRAAVLDPAHALRGARGIRDLRWPAGPGTPPGGDAPWLPRARGGRVIAALLLALQVGRRRPRIRFPRPTPCPQITLDEAIRRSARLDPDYVQALGDIDNAEWGRRAAMLAFFVPSMSLGLDETKYSTEFFNPSDPANPTSTLVVGTARADYEVFSLRKFSELGRTRAEVASAEAGRAGAALPGRAGDRIELLRRPGEPGAHPSVRGAGEPRARRPCRRPRPGRLGRGGADRLASAGAGADPRRGRGAAPAERTPHRPAGAGTAGRRSRAGGRGAARHHARPRPADRVAPGPQRGAGAGPAVPGRPGERARRRRGAQVAAAATTCRPWGSARCTSATTPRSFPARPTSLR